MGMIGPTGDVWLGHVPWNNNYKNVYWEGAQNKQLILNEYMTLHTTNYTFIREDTNIRVPYNADDIYGVNYCMYQNDGMWFCCFVNTVTYVNNNTALLHLEEDIWHTWGGNMTPKACMVSRMHVDTDNLGQWRAPEPALELESVLIEEHDFNIVPDTVIVATNAVPKLKSGVTGTIFDVHNEDDFDGNDAVAGSMNGRIFSGARYYGFSTSNTAPLSNFLNNLNMAGAAESVCALFMVCSQFVSIGNDHRVSGLTERITETVTAQQKLGGNYTPHNKKCLTYPYIKIDVVDNRGGVTEFKCEDCDSWGTFTANLSTCLDPSAETYFQPSGYMGQNIDQSHLMPVAATPQGAWVYSGYQNWMAQNAEIIENKKNWNEFARVGGVAIATVGAILAIAATEGMALPAVLEGMASSGILSSGAMIAGGTAMGISGEKGKTSLEAELDYQSKQPDSSVGGSSNNALQGISRNCGGWRVIGLQSQSAARLDNFFDVFGYQIDLVRVPLFTGRQYWNYVKTIGANMQGNIPADRLALINKTMDSGITFWHTTDVGNYSLQNTISSNT